MSGAPAGSGTETARIVSAGDGRRTRRVLLLTNPAARRGTRRHDTAAAALRAAGAWVDAVITTRAGEAAELARSGAATYDAVFALGGDGTAIEVLGALAGTGCPVGILPGGTGNQLVRLLGIPLDAGVAAATLVAGQIARIDLGRLCDGRHFAIACAAGIGASMIERTPARLKRTLGVSAYVLTAAAATLHHEAFDVRATVDGEVIEQRATAVMVANFGAVMRSRFRFGPSIRHDDGLLDLCIFSPSSPVDSARLTWRLVAQRFADDRRLTYRQGRSIGIETTPPRALQVDGEMVGVTPFTVEVEPNAATVLIPAAGPSRGPVRGDRKW